MLFGIPSFLGIGTAPAVSVFKGRTSAHAAPSGGRPPTASIAKSAEANLCIAGPMRVTVEPADMALIALMMSSAPALTKTRHAFVHLRA